ncbi:MAG TPA: hypothetical protein VML54_03250 [Candidatus Limnocylindrales bacterium]|nr:hypothetical protein [Candidatus Limnocylindrales bacterium]
MLTVVFAVVGALFFGAGETEAACAAAGEYRVSGPGLAGTARLTETSSDAAHSSGQAFVTLTSRFISPVAIFAVLEFAGRYDARLTGGQCGITMTFDSPTPPGPGPTLPSSIPQVGGVLAFGGSVIMFLFHDDERLDLTLGIRSDFILRQ